MTSKLYIRDINKIVSLTQWCRDNLDREEWDLEVLAMFPPYYKFKFVDSRMSTLAVLSS